MYQFSSACTQIERRVGEGAPAESFFLIKDGIEEDCGLVRLVCRISSIPARSPPQGQGASPCLLFNLISWVHSGVRSCPLMLHSAQYLSHRKALWKLPLLKDQSKAERKHMITFLSDGWPLLIWGHIWTNQHLAELADARHYKILIAFRFSGILDQLLSFHYLNIINRTEIDTFNR